MSRKLVSSTALALIFTATGAIAAVTPEDVWESWQAFSTAAGQELTVGSAARNGDTLEVKGLVVTFKDDLGGSFSASIDTLNFKDNGDGTVAVTMADSYPMSLAFPPGDEGPSSIKLTVTQPGLAITAGGTAAETKYDFAAPTVSVTLDEVKDQSGTVMETEATLVMTETTASYLVARTGDTTALDSTFAAKALALNLSGKDAAGPGDQISDGTVTLALADIAGATKGNFLGAEIMANMATALNEGFTSDSSMSFGTMTLAVDVTDAAGPTVVNATAGGGSFVLAVDKTRVNYGTSLKGANITVSGAEIPFPEVAVAFGEYAFNVLMPASKSDTPQEFSFLTKLVDLTVSEDVWGLFDPAATLSREPATLIIDTKGTGRWLQDIMDPNLQTDGMEPPGELTSLDLTQLLVKAAGAEVGATGAVTVDNSGQTTFQGMPAPTGQINVTIKGVNKLVDNLIAMGLLPDDQAMGFRMMLGMFTRPGAAPDEVTSLIEFKDGGLFANGQQLQ
ncbi:MAG: DUF2125 domain-containing protein [Rhodobacterales bacterium]|nr:DUF2125 domain-containing protein [Rhodobacterales bacterium]